MRRVAVVLCLVFLAGCGGGDTSSPAPSGDPTLPFHVFSSSPTDNQTGVSVNAIVPVIIRFNRSVDTASIASGITVSGPMGDVPGRIASAGNTATFTPDVPFVPMAEYTLTVAAGVRAVDNETLSAPHILRFTTIAHTFNFSPNFEHYEQKAVRKVGEGLHCYIYLEEGRTVSQAVVDTVISRFDAEIYGNVTAAFGNEPNPGVDGSSKIYILLMDIVDGYGPGGGFVGGYFDPMNELQSRPGIQSNQKEMFYMDISPGNPSGTSFYRTLAHEFQHLIHWEQRENDDTWLNEAMSEAAPFYAGYGPNYARVQYFQLSDPTTGRPFRSDSLTEWDISGKLEDYSVVYMWAQYMADRFRVPGTVFRDILAVPIPPDVTNPGIYSVDQYLQTNHGVTFAEVFRDWSIAVFSGTSIPMPGHPEWSYTTIDTWPGVHNGILLPGFFAENSYTNITAPASLLPWSIGIYKYTSPDLIQPFSWNPASPSALQASFYDNAAGALTFDLVQNAAETYNGPASAYLILQNPGGTSSSSSVTTNPSISAEASIALSPAEKVQAVSRAIAREPLLGSAGEPTPVCIHEFLDRRAKEVRERVNEVREKRNAR